MEHIYKIDPLPLGFHRNEAELEIDDSDIVETKEMEFAVHPDDIFEVEPLVDALVQHEVTGEFVRVDDLQVEEELLLADPVRDVRAVVRVHYGAVNAFLGDYFARLRRGQPLAAEAPGDVGEGDDVDVEVNIDEFGFFVLPAVAFAASNDGEDWQVKLVRSRACDRVVQPIVERALGPHLARRLLRLSV